MSTKVTARDCLFCEANPGTSHEHTWPNWFKKAWVEVGRKAGHEAKFVHQLTNVDEEVLRTFGGEFTVKGFCTECNNGWMAQLEADVKPIKESLMLGMPTRLDRKDQKRLARWCVLKSLVFSLAIPETKLPAYVFRRFFREPLGGVTVQLMGLEEGIFGGFGTFRGIYVEKSPQLNSYQNMLRMGHAVLYVLGHTIVGDFDVKLGGQSIPMESVIKTIWPPKHAVIDWPLRLKVPPEAVHYLATEAT
jgi:hypothetical protein